MKLEAIDKAMAMVRIDYEISLIIIRHLNWQLSIDSLRSILNWLTSIRDGAADYCRDCDVCEGMDW